MSGAMTICFTPFSILWDVQIQQGNLLFCTIGYPAVKAHSLLSVTIGVLIQVKESKNVGDDSVGILVAAKIDNSPDVFDLIQWKSGQRPVAEGGHIGRCPAVIQEQRLIEYPPSIYISQSPGALPSSQPMDKDRM